METDVEVDIEPSEDYEAATRRLAEMEAARLAEAAARRDAETAKRRDAEEARRAAAEAALALEARAKEEALRAERYRAAASASLPPEPIDLEFEEPGTESGLVSRVRFTLPDGSTKTRLFASSDPLSAAFAFVRASGGAGEGERFDLVTRFPRAVIREPRGDDAARRAIGGCAEFLAAAKNGTALFVEKRRGGA
jgi:hypothetical protein